ncbi:MAG: glutathione S-transferase family protein [Sphingomonadales bacterium]|nr:glutathione S-transferase family protein [Sphingomonadales bacterium]
MRVLYHSWLSPQSRKIRMILGEKKLDVELKVERTWERRKDFLKMNPAGDVPVLVDEDGATISHHMAIGEYLDEVYPEPRLMGETPVERAEVRRIIGWFDGKMDREVTSHLVAEKVMKRFMKLGQPDSDAIRAALYNLRTHLDYIAWLVERRHYLAGSRLTMADLSAAAHISVLDYLGDIHWDNFRPAREWYMLVKSRRSFRPLLDDRIAGLAPPPHYDKVDF